jgi:segregation and condensation protein B
MEISQIIPHIEVLIFASDKPLTSAELLELVNGALGFLEDKASEEQVAAATEAVREKYASEFYPFEIKESGGGWQFLTKKEYHKTVALLGGDKFLKRLSPAAMETLAIIAYKQPITKGEIEAIRGVNSDYSVQKLLEKELIIITGRNEDMPGKPLVYSTSKSFMDYFGLNNASELPTIKEILMDQAVTPYVVTQDHPVESDRVEEFPSLFSVNGSGNLVKEEGEEGEAHDRKRPGSGESEELESSHVHAEVPDNEVSEEPKVEGDSATLYVDDDGEESHGGESHDEESHGGEDNDPENPQGPDTPSEDPSH